VLLSEHVPKLYPRSTGSRAETEAARPPRTRPGRGGRGAVPGVTGPVGGERRPPADRRRPRLQRGGPDLGDPRVRAHLRRPAAARREGRRPLRPQAGAAARTRPVRARLGGRRPGPGPGPARRRPGGAGRRRGSAGSGRARTAHRHLPRRPGPHPRLRHLERDERGRRCAGRADRRPADRVRRLAGGDVREPADRRRRDGGGVAGRRRRPGSVPREPSRHPRCRAGHRRHVAAGVRRRAHRPLPVGFGGHRDHAGGRRRPAGGVRPRRTDDRARAADPARAARPPYGRRCERVQPPARRGDGLGLLLRVPLPAAGARARGGADRPRVPAVRARGHRRFVRGGQARRPPPGADADGRRRGC